MSQKTSKQQRSTGRDAARRILDTEKKGRRRRSVLIKTGIVAAIIAAVTVAGFIIGSSASSDVADAGPVPDNGNIYGGIMLPAPERPDETDLQVDTAAIPPAAAEGIPAGVAAPESGKPAKVVLYLDANCSHCAAFEEKYGTLLEARVQDGLIDLETRSVAFLDRASPTNYSSRAANALACVADWAPDKYLPFTRAMFRAGQENGELANKDLIALAESFDVKNAQECITEGTFRPFAKFTDAAAEAHGITATPAVFINGKAWDLSGDLEASLPSAKDAK